MLSYILPQLTINQYPTAIICTPRQTSILSIETFSTYSAKLFFFDIFQNPVFLHRFERSSRWLRIFKILVLSTEHILIILSKYITFVIAFFFLTMAHYGSNLIYRLRGNTRIFNIVNTEVWLCNSTRLKCKLKFNKLVVLWHTSYKSPYN